ncbi:MAG: cation-translocating P-type ATPase, partial [Deltaproteobacteria bacterium]|nr:cation-translocating P-type ATPase [Deltaproteobacteria bacterium]
MNNHTSCLLCGTQIASDTEKGGVFCCTGCAMVYEVIQGLDESRIDSYLEAARKTGIIPNVAVGAESFPRLTESLPRLAESFPRHTHPPEDVLIEELFAVSGLHCPSCAWILEKILCSRPGMVSARADFFSSMAKIRYDMRVVSRETLNGILSPFGYALNRPEEDEKSLAGKRHSFAFLVCAIITMNLMTISSLRYFAELNWIEPLPEFIGRLEFLLSLPVMWLGLVPLIRRAAAGIMNGRMVMDFLIVAGVSAAFLLSVISLIRGRNDIYFETAAGLVTITMLSRMIEAKLREKATAFLRNLSGMKVVNVRQMKEGKYIYRKRSEVVPGECAVFLPGEIVPFDGEVVSGEPLISEAILTGEPRPVKKVSGDAISAGSTVVDGRLEIKVTRGFEETALAGISRSVRETMAKGEATLRSGDRISAWFAPVVIIFAVLLWVSRLVIFGWDYASSTEGFIPSLAVLAVACPCAFSLAGAVAMSRAAGILLKNGILVKEPHQLENLHAVRRIIFDKTGTLTEGDMSVDRLVWKETTENELLSLVIAAETKSTHPVAHALRTYLNPVGAVFNRDFSDRDYQIEDLSGQGRSVRIGERKFLIGSRALFDNPFTPDDIKHFHTPVWFGFDGNATCCFLLTDRIKKGAGQAVTALREKGYKVELASGDRSEVCVHIAAELGIAEARGDMTVRDKLERVNCAKKSGQKIAYIGDGSNDALAMSGADISVAVVKSTDEALAAGGK